MRFVVEYENIHLLLIIHNWNYITVSRVSARINIYHISLDIKSSCFFLHVSKSARHYYCYDHFIEYKLVTAMLNNIEPCTAPERASGIIIVARQKQEDTSDRYSLQKPIVVTGTTETLVAEIVATQ